MILMLVAWDSIVRSLTCICQVILGWSRCQHCMQLQLHEFGYMLSIHMHGVLPPRDFATTFAIEHCLLVADNVGPPALQVTVRFSRNGCLKLGTMIMVLYIASST